MATIRIVAKALSNGRTAITYSELGEELGIQIAPGRGHKVYLEAATLICRDFGLPDIAPCVVTKPSLDVGVPMPSDDVFDDAGFWASSGLMRSDILAAQVIAFNFDWLSVRALWPK